MTLPPSVGTCFGFDVRAENQIWFLRQGTGTHLSVIQEDGLEPDVGDLLTEWIPNERNPIEARLHKGPHEGSYGLWVHEAGWYVVDPPGQKIITPSRYDSIEGSIRLLGLPMLLCCLARGDTTLHAAAVDVDGTAILLAAPGRHGKTSLSVAFLAAGYGLLSEDLSCLRATPSGTQVIPGPAGLRIRLDMIDHLPEGLFERVGMYGDRIAARVVDQSVGSAPVKLGGIFFLSDFGAEFELTRVDPGAAITDLWYLSFHLPNDSDRTRKFGALVDLAGDVPIWRLVRPRDRTLLAETVDRLVQCLGSAK